MVSSVDLEDKLAEKEEIKPESEDAEDAALKVFILIFFRDFR